MLEAVRIECSQSDFVAADLKCVGWLPTKIDRLCSQKPRTIGSRKSSSAISSLPWCTAADYIAQGVLTGAKQVPRQPWRTRGLMPSVPATLASGALATPLVDEAPSSADGTAMEVQIYQRDD